MPRLLVWAFPLKRIPCSLDHSEGERLQRLFSMFPSGWPGGGLLLLRLTDGIFLLHTCIACWLGNGHHIPATLLAIVAALALLLLIGLWTPIAGALSAATMVPLLIQEVDEPRILICLMALGVSILMLGPGAISIDAAMFGRHRLDLPDR
jgi:putative oxidoreductase